jgi:hypothetical protein
MAIEGINALKTRHIVRILPEEKTFIIGGKYPKDGLAS